MVDTLKARIALDGGEKIRKELEELGQDGAAAFKKLKAAADDLASSGSRVNSFVGRVRADFDSLKSKAAGLSSDFNRFGSSLTNVARSMAVVTGAATALAAGILEIAKASADAADGQQKAAQKLGLNITEYGKLQFVLEQNDVTAEQFQSTFTKFNKVFAEAATGAGDGARLFDALGVSVRDQDGKLRSSHDVFLEIGAAIRDLGKDSAVATESVDNTTKAVEASAKGVSAAAGEVQNATTAISDANKAAGASSVNDARQSGAELVATRRKTAEDVLRSIGEGAAEAEKLAARSSAQEIADRRAAGQEALAQTRFDSNERLAQLRQENDAARSERNAQRDDARAEQRAVRDDARSEFRAKLAEQRQDEDALRRFEGTSVSEERAVAESRREEDRQLAAQDREFARKEAAAKRKEAAAEASARFVEQQKQAREQFEQQQRDAAEQRDEARRDAERSAQEAIARQNTLSQQTLANARASAKDIAATGGAIQGTAEAASSLNTNALQAAISLKIFGKTGASLLPTFASTTEELKAIEQQAVDSLLTFTEVQAAIGDEFGDTFNRLTRTVTGFRNQIGLAFTEPLTEIFKSTQKFLLDNKEAILQVANDIALRVKQVALDIASIIAGDDAAVRTEGLLAIRDAFVAIGESAKFAFGVIKVAFTAFVTLLDPIVGLINNLFGTDFSSKAVAIGIIILSLTGVFGLLASAIGLVISAAGFLGAAFGVPSAAIAAAIAGIIVGFVLLKTGIDAVGASMAQLADDFTGFIYDKFKSFFDGVASLASLTWESVSGGAGIVAEKIANFFGSSLTQIKQAFTNAGNDILQFFSDLLSPIQRLGEQIVDIAKKAAESVKNFLSGLFGGSAGTGNAGFASGGYIGGAGGPKSDAIPIWASNGEFMQQAAAVRKYGVNFMSRLNALQIPTKVVRGFADGGLVFDGGFTPAAPSLASAPQRGSSSTVNLTIEGQTFTGFVAPEDTVRSLTDFAARRRMASAGSKPAWYK